MVRMRFMWIWQAPKWPAFQVDTKALQPVLARARLAQGRLLGVIGSLQLADVQFLQLDEIAREAVATAQIEGETLQINSVRASAARRLGLGAGTTSSLKHREPRVEATLDVVEAALRDWPLPLSAKRMFAWHAALFPTGYSGVQQIVTGGWRRHEDPMQIVTPRLGKPDIVHYRAPDSHEVADQMKALIAWFNDTEIKAGMDGIVRAAIAHLWFEAIHPFEDGNGRIGRALAELALAQDLQSDQRLFSLSRPIWKDRAGYYRELQMATETTSLEVTHWAQWFAGCVETACLDAVAHVQAAADKHGFWARLSQQFPQLSPSQKKVLNKLYDAGPGGYAGGMSTEKYTSIAQVSRATAYRELTALTDLGLLVRLGHGRGTRYALQVVA